MSNKFKDISLKNHTYCFFDDIIKAENSNPIKTKIDEKSYKSFFWLLDWIWDNQRLEMLKN